MAVNERARAEREFVSRGSERLLKAYARAGGIAHVARRSGGAATIRNIALLELAPIAADLAAERTHAFDALLAAVDHWKDDPSPANEQRILDARTTLTGQGEGG